MTSVKFKHSYTVDTYEMLSISSAIEFHVATMTNVQVVNFTNCLMLMFCMYNVIVMLHIVT